MFLSPIGHFQSKNWDSFGNNSHPQFEILKNHVDRAVQDLFLNSLRIQNKDFLYIFDSKDQIENFAEKMIKYWEKEEKYEVCSEILKLKKKMIIKWKKSTEKEKNKGEEIQEWLRSYI